MLPRLVLSLALVALIVGRVGPMHDLGTTRQIDLTVTEGTSMAAAASPDRRSMAIDPLGGIWILPFRGGEAKRITPELLEARQPAWSPDGQSIAFQGYDDGTWHIYVIPRDGGEAKAITSGLFDDREPAWSHDGSRIAFSSDRYGGITTIWTVAVSSGEVHRISTRDGWMPAWSASDGEVLFVSADAAERSALEASPGLYAVSLHKATILPGYPSASRRSESTLHTAYASRSRSWRAISPVQNSPPTSSQCAGRLPGASGSLCSCA